MKTSEQIKGAIRNIYFSTLNQQMKKWRRWLYLTKTRDLLDTEKYIYKFIKE